MNIFQMIKSNDDIKYRTILYYSKISASEILSIGSFTRPLLRAPCAGAARRAAKRVDRVGRKAHRILPFRHPPAGARSHPSRPLFIADYWRKQVLAVISVRWVFRPAGRRPRRDGVVDRLSCVTSGALRAGRGIYGQAHLRPSYAASACSCWRRRARPGRSPEVLPSVQTRRPLTKTCSMPAAGVVGVSKVARSMTVVGSKTVMSA